MDLNMSENHIDKLRDKVNVAVRVRPFLSRELGETEKWVVTERELRQKQMDEKTGVSSAFAFDHVFDPSVKTSELYNKIVAPIVSDSIKGFNGTILCYGQTSSGKTHTMYGSDKDKGIITLFAEHLFQHIKADEECKEYFIKVGVIEIYNEKFTDLLQPENTIEVRIGKGGSVFPAGLKEVEVNNSSELIDIVRLAHAQRKTRETQMNDQSSRSHTVLRVSIEVANLSNGMSEEGEPSDAPSSALTTSVLHFVDLAGSEKQSQTGSEGDGLREAGHINKSLSTLSMVINQLSKETQPPEQSEQAVLRASGVTGPRKQYPPRIPQPQPITQTNHVSFRNSKLTRLLESTLRGEAYITMICNVTIANLVETKSTLNFAKTAKNIKVQPKQNFGTSNELKKRILELQLTVAEKDKEVTRLQQKLDSYRKILPGQHAAQRLKSQLNRSFDISSPDKRRHTLCPSNLSTVSTFKLPYTKFPSDDGNLGKFMSTEETALHFQKLTSEREARLSQASCDKEVQTDAQRFTTPKRTNSAATSCDTPVQTLRLTTSILRDAYETDALEWTDRMSFLEEENKTLRSLEAENKALLDEATQKIKTLNAEKLELENDVIRQMQTSKKQMHLRVADSAEYEELKKKLQELSSKIDIITTAAESEKQELQTELSERTKRFESIFEQNKAEIMKLTEERDEAIQCSKRELEETVASVQSKFDAISKTAEKDKEILQTKLTERKAEIIKLTEERDEAIECSKRELEETVASFQSKIDAITRTAEKDKEILHTELSERTRHFESIVEQNKAEIMKLTEERNEAIECSKRELEETVASVRSKFDAISKTAEKDKEILQTELTERKAEIIKLTEERDEAIECSKRELEETVASFQSKIDAITRTAEEDKEILQAKLSERIFEQNKAEIMKLTEERDRAVESSKRELEETVASFQSKFDTIRSTAEKEKENLQAELFERTKRFESIFEQNKAEIMKLTEERDEVIEYAKRELEETVASFQSKLDAITRTAEKDKEILQTELSERVIEQNKAEIIKLTEERDEAIVCSRRELEETVASFQSKLDAITRTAEKDKEILQTELSERKAEIMKLTEERDEVIQCSKKELEETVASFQSKIDAISSTAENNKEILQTELSELKAEIMKLTEERDEVIECSKRELEETVASFQSKIDAVSRTVEKDKEILHTELSERILDQNKAEIMKLTEERDEAIQSSKREVEETVASFQSKLDAITRTAEKDKEILQTELSERKAEILKLTEERDEAIQCSKRELEETVASFQSKIDAISRTAEKDKEILQTELSERIIEQNKAEIIKLTEERDEAIECSKRELEETVASFESKFDTISRTAGKDKEILQTELSERTRHFESIVEQNKAEIMKLTEERDRAVESSKRELEETVASFQSKIDAISRTAEKDKEILQTELSERTRHFESIVEQNKAEIMKLTEERDRAVESSKRELEETVASFQSKIDAITRTAEENKEILQAKLSECTSNFDNIIQQMKSEISKVSMEREEFEDKCLMLQSSEIKLKESFNQLLTVEKGILEKELEERESVVKRLEEELKTLKEVPPSPTPGSSSKLQKIKVNRSAQCDLWKDDEAYYNELRRAAMAYRSRAKKAEGDLEKLGDTVQLLNEKDTRIGELEASIERLEKDIRDLNKIILDSAKVDDGKEFGFERGIQCNLLDEQIEDAKTGEKRSVLPTSVADILTLRSEVQAAKDKNHQLYALLRKYESQQEQAAAAGGGLLSSLSFQPRSNFGIGKPKPAQGSGPVRMNFGAHISPAVPFQLPSSKPKLRTPSQFLNQPVAPAQETQRQRRDPEEVENVPVQVEPPTNLISKMESGNQKKKNGDGDVISSHLNPKRIKMASTPTEHPKTDSTAKVTSSSVSYSCKVTTSSSVTSVSSSARVQQPMIVLNDDDEDSGSEDFREFLDRQVLNKPKQSQPVSLPKAPTLPPPRQQPSRIILEDTDEEEEEESMTDFLARMCREHQQRKQNSQNQTEQK